MFYLNERRPARAYDEDERMRCAQCGDWREARDLVTSPNGSENVCEGCRDDILSTCAACGEIHLLVAYATPIEGYCQGCTAALNAELREPKDGKCPGCGRSCRECWILPCLELEVALHAGADEVNAWLEAAGAPFRVERRE